MIFYEMQCLHMAKFWNKANKFNHNQGKSKDNGVWVDEIPSEKPDRVSSSKLDNISSSEASGLAAAKHTL